MGKLITLHMIIRGASKSNDSALSDVCTPIYENGYCHGIKCNDCPFDNTKNIDECNADLDNKQIVSEAAISHLHDNHPKAYREFYDKL